MDLIIIIYDIVLHRQWNRKHNQLLYICYIANICCFRNSSVFLFIYSFWGLPVFLRIFPLRDLDFHLLCIFLRSFKDVYYWKNRSFPRKSNKSSNWLWKLAKMISFGALCMVYRFGNNIKWRESRNIQWKWAIFFKVL